MSNIEPVPAPVTGEEEELPTEKITPQVFSASDDRDRHESDYNKVVRALAAQPKVRVRIPEPGEYVQINGWRWQMAPGSYEVPQQVADLLIEAKRI